MFASIKNLAVTAALTGLKEKVVNPNLEGIAKVTAVNWENQKLRIVLELEGLEDRPVTLICKSIAIEPDGSAILAREFESNMPFAKNILNRFLQEPIAIPEGGARIALIAAKKVLGL